MRRAPKPKRCGSDLESCSRCITTHSLPSRRRTKLCTAVAFNLVRDLGRRLFSSLVGWEGIPFTANDVLATLRRAHSREKRVVPGPANEMGRGLAKSEWRAWYCSSRDGFCANKACDCAADEEPLIVTQGKRGAGLRRRLTVMRGGHQYDGKRCHGS